MSFDRRGESLWQEWDGSGFQPAEADNIIFYTIGHVDVANDVVLRALASAVQREGIVDTLGQAFQAIKPFSAVIGFSGDIDNGIETTVCDQSGETYYGDIVNSVVPTTWVEVSNLAR